MPGKKGGRLSAVSDGIKVPLIFQEYLFLMTLQKARNSHLERFACHPEPRSCHPERSEGSRSLGQDNLHTDFLRKLHS
jgi:hypothetical protein